MAAQWSPEDVSKLKETLDNAPSFCASQCLAPWSLGKGKPLPTSLAELLARRLVETARDQWGHDLDDTRTKLIEVARRKRKAKVLDDESDAHAKRARLPSPDTEGLQALSLETIDRKPAKPMAQPDDKANQTGDKSVRRILFPVPPSRLKNRTVHDDFMVVPTGDDGVDSEEEDSFGSA